ncbi:MAG: Crp/Fnr family transcriptional regulator [Treponema sp.]|jgi:CRP/FNR family transcriptional regulator|nr:Crp/Fnr family transcriptional regulator [Treponema sp.]
MIPILSTGKDKLDAGLFARLKSAATGGWLAEAGTTITVAKGRTFVNADEVPLYCYYVLRGRVISYEYTLSGRERIYNFIEEGSLMLDANTLMQQPPPVSFMAITPATLLRIPRDVLLKKIHSDPEVALDIISSVSNKFLLAMEQIRETTHHNVLWKVCNLLVSFSERYGVEYDGKLLIKEKISQQVLANLLGVNRITLVRIIKELRELNLIEQINGFYCIRSIEKLKQFMEEEQN